jgi:cell division protein ZapA
MKSAPGGVTITILGKELMVACPEDERPALVAAARSLDQRMREIQDGGKVIGSERVAVMVALNLANELLQVQQQTSGMPLELDARLSTINSKIEAALRD